MHRLPVLTTRPAADDGEGEGDRTTRSAVRVAPPAPPEAFSLDHDFSLRDAQGRAYSYLRLSVTDRCDLACVYCMPPGGEEEHARRAEVLTFEEIVRIVAVFVRGGIRRVRLTGGEPLVRKDIVRLAEMIAQSGPDIDLVLTTNGTRLAELAEPLARAGVRGVNLSIDSLDAARFAELTRGGRLEEVLAGLHAAKAAGLGVKLNSVLLRGVNDDEAEALVRFAWSVGATPRFIELMPLGEGAALYPAALVTSAELETRLAVLLEPGMAERPSLAAQGPAVYRRARGDAGHRVGFISATTANFCDACNRVRVTARGDLRACLAHRRAISLRDILRAGGSDRDLGWALAWALGEKGHGHGFTEGGVTEHESVGMSLVGG